MPSPGHLALVTGLVSASYFTFGNLAAANFGVMPAIARGNTTLSVTQKVSLWKFFYDTAKKHMASSGLISAVAISIAAYHSPERSPRNLLITGAASAFVVLPLTLLFLMPVNNELADMLKSAKLRPMNSIEETRALDLLDRWSRLHWIRIFFGAIAWSIALKQLANPS
ncbi:hypothetical protein B0H10DRAFT_1252033 [Mycena sp. CBHHK59/15]|nr:hypothetical protein B0H10DRAFT_1252033 [Mycena sp. CBHHK59/15]